MTEQLQLFLSLACEYTVEDDDENKDKVEVLIIAVFSASFWS